GIELRLLLTVQPTEALHIAFPISEFIEISVSGHLLDAQVIGHFGECALGVAPYLILLANVDQVSRLLIAERSDSFHITLLFLLFIICRVKQHFSRNYPAFANS